MGATVEGYLKLVSMARDGRLKLPAFQRNWKWKNSQVVLLFDSLRQGYPVGGFLFMKASQTINLTPRSFRGAITDAAAANHEYLVLDGQQRITAGIDLFYGTGEFQYFIDVDRVHQMFNDQAIDINSTAQIRDFLSNLEASDRYCVPKRKVANPSSLLWNKHLLWTGLLIDDIELERALKAYGKAHPEREDFISLVIGKNFRPAASSNIPITTIDDDVTIEAVSRIFSTLNSTGKMLTPFELVVSILYPSQLNLYEDVANARDGFPYYARIDPHGDILLQTIALLAGRDTKKAALPKNIDAATYRLHRDDAVKYIDKAGKLLTEAIGLGLDQSSELLVYPVIFSPMAYVLKVMDGMQFSVQGRAIAERKIVKWFVGAILQRRYQQSTHDKQARDRTEIVKWIDGSDDDAPQWIKEVFVPNLRSSDPDSATGKLLRCLVNRKGIRDPYTHKQVGVGSGRQSSAKHHIFPTKFVQNLSGWDAKKDSANIALNIMYCEESTNAAWLNLDPAIQVNQSLPMSGSKAALVDIYTAHGIDEGALDIMMKSVKERKDFFDFIERREAFFLKELEALGFRRPMIEQEMVDDDELDE